MFAETGIESLNLTQVGAGFVFLGIVLQFALVILTIVTMRKTQEREVSFKTVFASKESVDEVRSEVREVKHDVVVLRGDIVRNGEERRIRIEAKVEDARKESRELNGDLGEKVSGVADQVSGLEAKQEIFNQQILALDTKIVRLLERRGGSAVGI